MGFPVVAVQVAFSTDPGATPTWTDITPYVLDWSVSKGRQRERERMEAGEGTLTLLNTDRRFEPEYAASPYYPNVVPNRRCRIQATWLGVTYDLATGYIDEWPPIWAEFNLATVAVKFTDGFKVLAGRPLTDSLFTREVRTDQVTYLQRSWLRLNRIEGDYTAANSAPAGPMATPARVSASGGVTENEGLLPYDPDGAFAFDGTAGVEFDQSWTTPASGPRTVFFVFTPDEGGQSGANPFIISFGWLDVYYTGTTLSVGVRDDAGATATLDVLNVAAGTRHDVLIQGSTVLGGTVQAVVYVDGVNRGTVQKTLGTGRWKKFPIGGIGKVAPGVATTGFFKGVVDEVMIFEATLPSSRYTAYRTAIYTSGAGEQSGARIGRVLDMAGWPASDRLLDTGQSKMMAFSPGGSALEYLLRVMDSEAGLIYMDGSGRVRFRERHSFLKTPLNTAQATWVDARSGAGLQYEGIEMVYSDAPIINEARYARSGGPTQVAIDAASQTRYFPKSEEITDLLNQSDLEVADAANYRVQTRKDPLLESPRLTVNPQLSDTIWPEILTRDLGEMVTIKRTPAAGGATMTKSVRLEKITHSGSRLRWTTTYQVSPVLVQSYWILGTSTLGTGTRLAF